MDVKPNLHIRKADLLDIGIVTHMLQLLRQPDGCGIVHLPQISPEITGQIMHQLCRRFRLKLAKLLDAAQSVVNKVGPNLAHHGGDPAFRQLPLLLRQNAVLLCQPFFLLPIALHFLDSSNQNGNEHCQQGKQQTGGISPPIEGGDIPQNTHHQNQRCSVIQDALRILRVFQPVINHVADNNHSADCDGRVNDPKYFPQIHAPKYLKHKLPNADDGGSRTAPVKDPAAGGMEPPLHGSDQRHDADHQHPHRNVKQENGLLRDKKWGKPGIGQPPQAHHNGE